MLCKLQKQLCRTVDPSIAVFSIGIAMVDVHLNWLKWLNFLIFVAGLLIIINRLHNFSATIPRCFEDVYISIIFPCTARL